mmetsp:Transcript_18320/g.51324  ORF Transcript_18320/g.51324 Transcript_18320/m.51324 type:complete len:495 (-) Transcript_18320:65-1549(-)
MAGSSVEARDSDGGATGAGPQAKKLRINLSNERTSVGVLGGGAWGTALAIHCAQMGHQTWLWSRNQQVVESINTQHENTVYLKGFQCPKELIASTDKKAVVEQAELVLMVIPTPFVTEALGLKNPPPPLFCSLLFTCPSIHCSSLPTHSAMQPHFPAPCLGAFCLPLLFAASVSTFPLFFAPFHKSIHPPIHSCMGSTPWHRRQPQEASCRLHNLPNCTRMLLPLTPKGGSVAAFAAAVEDIASRLDPKRHIMVSCTKGILNDTLETVDEILHRVLPPPFHGRLAFLSGPSFAAEVARGLPSAVTIAAREEEVAMHVQLMLSTARFRCYRTNDVTGVELGGALKNVLAIACGISDGLQFGNNCRAALITRGNNEIQRLALAKGASPHTMAGLSGVGDLVLTCTADLSRNRTVGLRLGKGEKLTDIIASMTAVAEGVLTSRSADALASKMGVDCPIINGIFRVIHGGADPAAVTEEVMSRELRFEVDDDLAHTLS